MPARVSSEQLDVVESVTAGFPEGATLQEITRTLTGAPSERTVRRLLVILVDEHRIERIGNARSTRYRVLKTDAPGARSSAHAAAHIPPPSAERAVTFPGAAPVSSGSARGASHPMPDMCEQIFAAAIGDIVRYAFSRGAAVAYLQRLAERNIAAVDDRKACLALLKARLDAFAVTDADAYGLETEQYQRWRAADGGAARDSAPQPASTGLSADVAAPPAGLVTSAPAIGAELRNPRTDMSARPRAAEQSSHAGFEHSASRPRRSDRDDEPSLPEHTTPAHEVAPEREQVGEPRHRDDPESAARLPLQQLLSDSKGLLTPGRIAAAALWTGAVSTASTHLIGGAVAPLLTLPLAGVPALLFVDRDRKAAGNPMDPRAMLTTLVAGGGGSMVCATPVTYAFDAVLSLFT